MSLELVGQKVSQSVDQPPSVIFRQLVEIFVIASQIFIIITYKIYIYFFLYISLNIGRSVKIVPSNFALYIST